MMPLYWSRVNRTQTQKASLMPKERKKIKVLARVGRHTRPLLLFGTQRGVATFRTHAKVFFETAPQKLFKVADKRNNTAKQQI